MDTKDGIDISGDGNQDIANRKTYHRPIIGQMTGGSNTIHTDEGKDKVIEALTQKDSHRQETFIHELHGFREYIMRQDDEIKRLSDRVDRIIKHSYLRNERNMERIDKDKERFDRLIDIIEHQDKKIQDRADRVLAILEKKMGL